MSITSSQQFEITTQYIMEAAISFERSLILAFGWPEWALRTIEILTVVVVILAIVEYGVAGSASTKKCASSLDPKRNASFHLFQLQYLSVYFTVMLADWLQGTNMYTLYSSYGVNIGALFLTGFLSSAVFGTFLGVYVDTWGRRFGCLLFCILEVCSCRTSLLYSNCVHPVSDCNKFG